MLILSTTTAIAGTRNSGYYDHQVIEYVSSTVTAGSVQEAQLLSHGNIVFHIVDVDGNTPAVQCARLLAALPQDATSCNTLNSIPTDQGYAGGAWNRVGAIYPIRKGNNRLLLSASGNFTARTPHVSKEPTDSAHKRKPTTADTRATPIQSGRNRARAPRTRAAVTRPAGPWSRGFMRRAAGT